jgi:uncharacterized protein (DUF58 family)
LLVVDQRFTMFFGSVKNMKSVTAAEVAALAAWRVLAQKDRVGAIVFNDSKVEEIRPHLGQSTVMRILQSIINQNRALSLTAGLRSNPGMFNEALRRCNRIAKRDCLVCVISDGTGNDLESRRLLGRIARNNDVRFVFVHDPLEIELPNAGPLVFADGNNRLAVDTGNQALRKRFCDASAKTRVAGRKFFLRQKTPVLPLSTNEGLLKQIRLQLGGRLR